MKSGITGRLYAHFIIIFIFISSTTLFALDPDKAITQYIQDVWQKEDGLPQNSVLTIIQTSDGYLWLGTEEGIARFDGAQFRVFDKSNTKEITNPYVFALFEDNKKNLWIGTYGGGLLLFKDGKFSVYTTRDGLSDDRIWTIYQDKKGNLWLGTDAGGLNLFRDGKFSAFTTKDGLFDNAVTSIYEDRKGVLWIGTRGGLNQMIDNKIRPFLTEEGALKDPVRSIYQDDQQNLWIGTSQGLKKFSNGKLITYSTEDGLPNDRVWCVTQDRHGNLWIGTDGGGIARYKDGKFKAYSTKDGLANDLVRSLFEDREGSLWIGTNGGGLNRLKDLKFTTFTTKEGLSSDFIWPIFEDSQKNLWIGTDGRGLNRISNGNVTAYTTKNGLSSDRIFSLTEDSSGDLWVGTYAAGINRLRNGKVTTYTTKEGLANDLVLVIYPDSSGNLWVGTPGGLSKFNDGKFENFTTAHGLSSDRIRVISESKEGLWIGTRNGLNLLKDQKFISYSTKEGLSNNFISSLYADRDGVLWIGTVGGGLNRFKNGKFTNYTTKEGLFDDVVFQILEDRESRLWMSCAKGIFSVTKKELEDFAAGTIRQITSRHYGNADGMRSSECNGGAQPAGFKSRDGRLWFPTTKGVVMIDPARINLNMNREPPKLNIEEINVDDKRLDLSIFNGQQKISFPPGHGRVEFEYTALSFLVPASVRFKYILEGFDEKWIDAGTRRKAYYTNIPPGKYRFRIIACNNDGVWNNAGTTFSFYLEPHFYQTGWFYALCALSCLFIGWTIHRYRVGRLIELERIRTRIATDLHDDIGSGLSQIAILTEVVRQKMDPDKSPWAEDLMNIANVSRELVDTMSDIVWAVNPGKDHMGDLVQRMHRFANDVLDVRKIKFQFDHSEIEPELKMPPDVRRHVFLIFKEALNNIVRHSASTEVTIALRIENNLLELEIRDNGKGFNLSEAIHGHGLRNMRQRAEVANGQIEITPVSGKGTTLALHVPLSHRFAL